MVDDLNHEIKRLKTRIRLIEQLSTTGLVLIGVIILTKSYSYISVVVIILLLLQLVKALSQRQLKVKTYLIKEVEQRTEEIRSEKDAIQEESMKLANALRDLGEAQDELVRRERMATIGQLTKGLVDRILNPLNYINNFSNLTAGLAKDLRENLESQKERMDRETYEDSLELLEMMDKNLSKISEHGYNTVRIVKAMEELLKDHRSNLALTNVNDLCRVTLKKINKRYGAVIQEKGIRIDFEPLTLSLMLPMDVEQMLKVMSNIMVNSIYALQRKLETTSFDPLIKLTLRLETDELEIRVWDNGTGIDERLRDKIFAPFFTTKTTSEAAGIGLYLCREIIQNHRGTISVNSEKGMFTEMLIRIPIYLSDSGKRKQEEESVKGDAYGK